MKRPASISYRLLVAGREAPIKEDWLPPQYRISSIRSRGTQNRGTACRILTPVVHSCVSSLNNLELIQRDPIDFLEGLVPPRFGAGLIMIFH
jgi:hypothetical protein